MKRLFTLLTILILVSLLIGINKVYAEDLDDIIIGMSDASTINGADANSGIAKTINKVIGFIQLTGSGISVIVVTLLGIKYLLASPSDKADTKKMIMPVIIGCVLLFGAVNIVGIIADLTDSLESESTSNSQIIYVATNCK